MHADESTILSAFVELNAGVVFSAEVFIWPDVKLAVRYSWCGRLSHSLLGVLAAPDWLKIVF